MYPLSIISKIMIRKKKKFIIPAGI